MVKRVLKIYIAGPMTGYPDYNRAAFNAKASELMAEGHIVLNPAVLPGGLCQSGDFHPSAKYRQSDIELARQLHRCGVPRREIAEKLEMPLGMINQYVYFERRVHEV
ncbi:DUF4406 domain-containing protein [Escherichia coli]|nr:DUF4406 domain-containing protein [Escherichia coli]